MSYRISACPPQRKEEVKGLEQSHDLHVHCCRHAPSLIHLPRVTMIRPMAANAAAALPPEEPLFIHKLMISIGFH